MQVNQKKKKQRRRIKRRRGKKQVRNKEGTQWKGQRLLLATLQRTDQVKLSRRTDKNGPRWGTPTTKTKAVRGRPIRVDVKDEN